MNTADFATEPDCASLPPDFVQRLAHKLGQARMLHLWCPERAPLLAAQAAVLQALGAQRVPVRVMAQGQWLPLLQTLNGWIEASLRGEALPTPAQAGVWLLGDAQALSDAHQALLARLLAQFPELPLRLVLLSRTPQPPRSPTAAEVLAIEWLTAEPPAWAPVSGEATPPTQGAGHGLWWVGGALLLALVAAALWWGTQVPPARRAERLPEPEAASVPAPSAEASAAQAPSPDAPAPAALPASEPASAASAASASVAQAAPRAALQRWLQGLPEGSFVVLHGQFASAREAEAFKARDALLANARIVQAVWSEGLEARYGVLTGPFRSADRAANHLQRLPWRAQALSLSRDALLSP